MRCSDCNLMVSAELGEPEVSIEIDGNEITGEVRLALLCAECGIELRETTFDVSQAIDNHEDGNGHELSIETTSEEATEEARKGRKHVGYSVDAVVKCSCGWSEECSIIDSVLKSEMDEC